MGKREGREVVGSMSDWSGVLKDLFRQIDDGSLTLNELIAVTEHRNPFGVADFLDQIIFETKKLLSERFGKKIKIDPLPAEFTEENLRRWEKYNLKPIFLPYEEIAEDCKIKDWVKPEKWFYDQIKRGKISADSAKLKRGWYLADFTVGADYNDGKQVFINDPLSSLIERLRGEKKVGKYDQTPMGSRFAIMPQDEWPLVFAELANEIGVKPEQIRLERAIEFNAIGNLYDENRGKFRMWEWFSDAFEVSDRLIGGNCAHGGLASVDRLWSDDRGVRVAGRPLVSFVK